MNQETDKKNKERNDEYLELLKKEMPKSKHLSTIIRAFIVGGIICCFGQLLTDLYKFWFTKINIEDIKAFVTLTIITITAILTGLGIYDKIGAFGGAGSIVPITGFANSVVSASIEHNREGIVLGLCSNMFTVAGPVIVFGISASVLVGVVTLIFPGFFM